MQSFSHHFGLLMTILDLVSNIFDTIQSIVSVVSNGLSSVLNLVINGLTRLLNFITNVLEVITNPFTGGGGGNSDNNSTSASPTFAVGASSKCAAELLSCAYNAQVAEAVPTMVSLAFAAKAFYNDA